MKAPPRNLLLFLVLISVLFARSGTAAPEVTVQNYVRAETDVQMKTYVEEFDIWEAVPRAAGLRCQEY
jgi:hypothetical protein